jgi:glycosyltransferase involved in cell wall biosynthesis
MKSIRIFIDCHVFEGSFQGTTTYLKGIYLEMIKDRNYEFFFAANDVNCIKPIFGEQENIHYLTYSSKNKFYRLLIDIPRLIKQNKIDYAHFQYIVPPIKHCKYITTVHDVLFLDFPNYFPLAYRIKNKFLFKWSAKHSEIVLTVSEFSKKQIQKHFGIKEIAITPNAVDPVYFEEYNKTEIKKQVSETYNLNNYWLYISRWEPRKNHLKLLEVFVESKFYNDFTLVFIGDKAITDKAYDLYYERLSDEVKSKVITFNKINFEELLLLLRGADLSVYPSFAEGFGIPPLEALAAKIPSICSNTTAMADFEFMKEDTFNPYDKHDMGKAIHKALSGKTDTSKIEVLKRKYNWGLSASIIKDQINANVEKQL